MKKWKLKLNFLDGVPTLEKEVNRVYHSLDMLTQVIDFYTSSGLLRDNNIEIEVIKENEESEENKYSF